MSELAIACGHCLKVVTHSASREHWRDCREHPARAEVSRLREEVERWKAEVDRYDKANTFLGEAIERLTRERAEVGVSLCHERDRHEDTKAALTLERERSGKLEAAVVPFLAIVESLEQNHHMWPSFDRPVEGCQVCALARAVRALLTPPATPEKP